MLFFYWASYSRNEVPRRSPANQCGGSNPGGQSLGEHSRETSLISNNTLIEATAYCYNNISRPYDLSKFFSRFSPSSRLFPTASHAERTSTLRPGYEALGSDLVLGSRAVACWNNETEDFGLQMSDMLSRCVTPIFIKPFDSRQL